MYSHYVQRGNQPFNDELNLRAARWEYMRTGNKGYKNKMKRIEAIRLEEDKKLVDAGIFRGITPFETLMKEKHFMDR